MKLTDSEKKWINKKTELKKRKDFLRNRTPNLDSVQLYVHVYIFQQAYI